MNTSIEWLINKLEFKYEFNDEFYKLVKEAKLKEQKQIEDAFNSGKEYVNSNASQYFNTQYKQLL